MKIPANILAAVEKLVDQLSQQSSLSGLISIGLVLGIALPSMTLYAGGIVAVAGILKVLLPDVKS